MRVGGWGIGGCGGGVPLSKLTVPAVLDSLSVGLGAGNNLCYYTISWIGVEQYVDQLIYGIN